MRLSFYFPTVTLLGLHIHSCLEITCRDLLQLFQSFTSGGELICIISASLTKDLFAHPSVALGSICSSIVKPTMREGFLRCEPLRWIKVYQPSNKILEVRVKGLHIPSDERFTRVLLTKAVPKRFQRLSPRSLKSPSKLSGSAKYEFWRSRTWASASSLSGSDSSSTYNMTCFKIWDSRSQVAQTMDSTRSGLRVIELD